MEVLQLLNRYIQPVMAYYDLPIWILMYPIKPTPPFLSS